MPKISKMRSKEVERLAPVLAILNREYAEHDSTHFDEEDVDGVALAATETKLRKWIDASRPRNEDVGDYLYRHPALKREFFLLTQEIGIPEEVFRSALAFQQDLSGEEKFKKRVQMVSSMLEYGFGTGGESAKFGAREAMYWFLLLRKSPLADRLRKCAKQGCERYFLNLGGKAKCCCRSHAQALVNQRLLPKLQKQRDQEKKPLLERVQKAIDNFKGPDWKRRVSKRTGVSLHFITRNLNAKQLRRKKQ
jgi:hypothetical protein